jgi:hypothetical protein
VTSKNNCKRLITSHGFQEFSRIRQMGIAVRLLVVRPKLQEEWPTALGASTSMCAGRIPAHCEALGDQVGMNLKTALEMRSEWPTASNKNGCKH